MRKGLSASLAGAANDHGCRVSGLGFRGLFLCGFLARLLWVCECELYAETPSHVHDKVRQAPDQSNFILHPNPILPLEPP